jgi:hypothetical protein
MSVRLHLLQSALQPLVWVSACSTVVEHSQQEGFTECRCQRHVKPPTWRKTKDLERSNFRHKRPPAFEATLANPAAEGGTMGEKNGWEILRKVATSTSHGTDGFTSPPKEGVLRNFFARKIQRLRPGLNPWTRVPKASTLPLDDRNRFLCLLLFITFLVHICSLLFAVCCFSHVIHDVLVVSVQSVTAGISFSTWRRQTLWELVVSDNRRNPGSY